MSFIKLIELHNSKIENEMFFELCARIGEELNVRLNKIIRDWFQDISMEVLNVSIKDNESFIDPTFSTRLLPVNFTIAENKGKVIMRCEEAVSLWCRIVNNSFLKKYFDAKADCQKNRTEKDRKSIYQYYLDALEKKKYIQIIFEKNDYDSLFTKEDTHIPLQYVYALKKTIEKALYSKIVSALNFRPCGYDVSKLQSEVEKELNNKQPE